MAKSSSSKNQQVEELVILYNDTSVTLRNNGNHHRKVNGDIIDSNIPPEKSVRKSKRLQKKFKNKEDSELYKEYEEIINNIERCQSKEEDITSGNEEDKEDLLKKITCTKPCVEENLLEIITEVITVDPLREEEEETSNSVDEINMCKSFKPNNMPRVVLKVVPEIENSKKRKRLLKNHTGEVDETIRSKMRSSRVLKNNKIIIEHEKINKSNNVLPKKSKIKPLREKTQSNNLNDKEVPTETDKAFPCNKWDKSFQYASALKLHTVSHTNEKPYICDRCPSSFTQKSHLTRHSLTHKKNAKEFKCSDCEMLFRLKFNWEAHMRVHSGAKPYTCKECGKSFSQKSHLNTHAKSHQEKKLTCDLCNKNFTLLHHVSQHMQGVHNY